MSRRHLHERLKVFEICHRLHEARRDVSVGLIDGGTTTRDALAAVTYANRIKRDGAESPKDNQRQSGWGRAMADHVPDKATGDVYRAFIDAVNRQDLNAAEKLVDTRRYRENCVGFTHGFVDWREAKNSIRRVWDGLPNLRVELDSIVATEDIALAHGTARGTATGRLYGAPATKRSFEASFFDCVRVENGLIVERIQQTDVLGQMRQLYGRAMGLVGLGAMFWRL